jgi:RNA polymerase sigma-70 factor (ECF subfamily)
VARICDQVVIRATVRRVKRPVNAIDTPLFLAPSQTRVPPVTALDAAAPDAAALAALIGRVAAARDRTAFAALYKHFAPRVKAYLVRAGMVGGEAEDVTQNVMLTLWRKAEHFDPARAGAATWVFAIARNARIDHARRKREVAMPDMEEPEAPDTAPSAEALTLAAERDTRLRGALNTLTPEQRQIVQLSFFSDTPHAAIASALNLPLGTVKSRIRLAMGKLRAVLEEGL